MVIVLRSGAKDLDRMKHTWPHNHPHSSLPNSARKFLTSDPISHLSGPPLNNERLGEIGRDPDTFWGRIRSVPLIKEWKVLNDSLFLVLTFGLGLIWIVTLPVLLIVGFATILAWMGIPILAATFGLIIWGAQIERSRIRVFLGVDIASPYRYIPEGGRFWKRAWGFVRNPQLWRDLVYLLLLFPIGLAGITVVVLPVQFFLAPVIVIFGGAYEVLGWNINHVFESFFAVLLGAVIVVPASMVINLLAALNAETSKRFLAASNEEVLTERVEELTESRSAIMRAMHLERRRIERDLHDGAQQRLVSLAMELGLAREKMGTDLEAAHKLIDESHEDAKLVLAELRDLVRGIHPAVLTDRGLDAAISAIAGRSRIPVGVDVKLEDRQPDEVEGTAYFVVVEALTNVAKHSEATEANVAIRRDWGWLRITVADNGKGGADPSKGTGLRGLSDRITALDGRMVVQSPPGVGTTLMVEIPCA